MTAPPKTIQIFLPGGDPRGLRIAEITTRIVQVIEVPRSRLDEFGRMPESSQVGLYFLFGSPSMAGMALFGRTANGWITWKRADGRTLDEVKRKGDAS